MKKLVFSQKLIKKEKLKEKDKHIIIKVCRKNIFTKIKGRNIPADASLIKIYVTTIQGAKRIVLLFDEEVQAGYFLFFRNKNDVIGKNISMKNPAFKKALDIHLNLLEQDMDQENFEIVQLQRS